MCPASIFVPGRLLSVCQPTNTKTRGRGALTAHDVLPRGTGRSAVGIWGAHRTRHLGRLGHLGQTAPGAAKRSVRGPRQRLGGPHHLLPLPLPKPFQMRLVDLGKQLLEAARAGRDDEVRISTANAAPFATGWPGAADSPQGCPERAQEGARGGEGALRGQRGGPRRGEAVLRPVPMPVQRAS